MVVVGADVHKRTHTFVAVDEVGKQVGQITVAATTKGHRKAIVWAWKKFGRTLTWGIEDCRHLSARLERDLLSAGQSVVRVPPKMMAEHRRTARTRGKSDPIDALAVARAAQREPDLPVATHDEVSRELKLLAEIARDELADVVELTGRINNLEQRIGARVEHVAPTLLSMPGVGALTAAKLVGEAAGVTRFKSEAAFARHAGIAPIPVWSGNTAGRVRLTRSGNRQLNAAIHRIAVTQIRLDGLGKTYYEKKKAEGMSTPEALRCLKRRLARVVFNHLHTDHQTRATSCLAAAA